MTALADIRSGLATRLLTTGLKIAATGEWPDQVVPPAACVKLVGQQHQQAFGNLGDQQSEIAVEVHLVLALKGGLVNAQKAIELYLSNTGTSSVYTAIAMDRYLGSAVKYTRISGWQSYDTIEVNGQEFMGAIVNVEVTA